LPLAWAQQLAGCVAPTWRQAQQHRSINRAWSVAPFGVADAGDPGRGRLGKHHIV